MVTHHRPRPGRGIQLLGGLGICRGVSSFLPWVCCVQALTSYTHCSAMTHAVPQDPGMGRRFCFCGPDTLPKFWRAPLLALALWPEYPDLNLGLSTVCQCILGSVEASCCSLVQVLSHSLHILHSGTWPHPTFCHTPSQPLPGNLSFAISQQTPTQPSRPHRRNSSSSLF